jgi:hypothetical protein
VWIIAAYAIAGLVLVALGRARLGGHRAAVAAGERVPSTV